MAETEATSPAIRRTPEGHVIVDGTGHPPGFRRARGRNWFMLGLTYASYYFCRYNLSPVAPELKASLSLSNAGYGAINTGRDLAYAVGQMVNGLLTDRLGGKLALTIGAVGTIILNLAFGLVSWGTLGSATLILLVLIRSADGYVQAFGAPGFIKINTAWFLRKERGALAGIFGAMINLGVYAANWLAKAVTSGAAIPLLFFTLAIPKLNWHYVFFVPPAVIALVVLLMNVLVRKAPEEAGFHVEHAEMAGVDPNEHVRLRDVWAKIASNPTVWIVAGAYFCTGFVRRAIESWWALYLDEAWHLGKESYLFAVFSAGLPLTATVGSIASGYVSDLLFAGRRAPVAAILYLAQVVLCCVALWLPTSAAATAPSTAAASNAVQPATPASTQSSVPKGAATAVLVIIAISMMCNSTHSILGTAAAMDLGGPKMAGCSSGIIDSFQYYGAMLSGFGLGWFFDYLGQSGAAPASAVAATAAASTKINPQVWIASMIPFGLLGTGLMTYLWIKHRGRNTLGA